MKTLNFVILSLIISSSAYASSTGIESDGILVWAFIGFGALLLMFQAVPALIVFFGIIKGLFISNETTQLKGEKS